jgi:hypothetical protein
MSLGIVGAIMGILCPVAYFFWNYRMYGTLNQFGYYPTPDLNFAFFMACGGAVMLIFGMFPGIKKVNAIQSVADKAGSELLK